MNDFQVLTEWTLDTRATEFIIHIYTMPINDLNKSHTESYELVKTLRRLNNTKEIVFYEQQIAALTKVENWGHYTRGDYQHRCIKLSVPRERELLQRLLLKVVGARQPKKIYAEGGLFINASPQYKIENINIHEALNLDFSVTQEGLIIVGFDFTHKLYYKDTLLEFVKRNQIQKGDRVIDPIYHISYVYDEVAPYTVSESSPYLGQSILQYYKNKDWILKKLNTDMSVVHVRNKENKIFPYAPVFLKKECSLSSLDQRIVTKINRVIKLGPNEKMTKSIREVQNILSRFEVLRLNKNNLLVSNQGYKIKYFPVPSLRFGKNVTSKSLKNGLIKGGVVDPRNLELAYFIDPVIIKNNTESIEVFMKNLEEKSKQLGVPLQRLKKGRSFYNQLDTQMFSSPNELVLGLKKIAKEFNCLTVVITTQQNIDKCYGAIKKEFGGNYDIPTQFVTADTAKEKNDYILLNILLGIYAKASIQSWILKEPLHSDCFIGLDVSHEENRHSTGLVQVVGKDGRVLSSKAMSTIESGERIRDETMKEIVYEAIHSYENQYGYRPKHVTFHRDGFCRENIDNIEYILKNLGVLFDYVEVIKKSNRRMANFLSKEEGWKTEIGASYLKDDLAYLCSTAPGKQVGMAIPVKITQVTGHLTMSAIVSDIFNLSHMHVGSLIKSRLPISTYYADLSSTFFNRGWISSRSNGLQFV
ncbi:stem cell self-renewal protein Piwi domain-containing protein [Brevibacillus laterosporus]|uniref:Piwi domain-containing protein n=1 Tax=Brevibacillus laterosporus TaxID=1465 RepID=UPI002404D13D|nr:Piwi domain-containing protein [Brevibacillus laterosporus]MDF9411346.1 stem cell self-renewal protein Piwi domain-containing protein [Brevibacillus laterosporus]